MKRFVKIVSAIFMALMVVSCSKGNQKEETRTQVQLKAGQNDIIKRADGTSIKLGGYMAASPNMSATTVSTNIDASSLPSKVDLRKFMSRVEDQGEVGSCTANATAGAYEYLLNVTKSTFYDVSRLFLYYNSRALNGEEGQDCGAILSLVLQSISNQGICDEKIWPYVESKKLQRPPQNAYTDAEQHKISNYAHVPTDLATWKSVLAEGYPIIFGVKIYSSFQTPRNGRISMPRGNDQDLGGHAMLCVGYSDPDRVFIVRNSWGHQWGDEGYCYIPYDYMMSNSLNSGDSWVIYDVNPVTLDEANDAWYDDDESLFVDMEDEFSNMSDEDWEDMCDELGDYDIVYRLGALYNMPCWGDEELSKEEEEMAIEKLKRIINMFGLNYSAKRVFKNCEKFWVEIDDFIEDTVEILSKYLSEGARATIASDMFEIIEADGDAAEDERLLVAGFVTDWLNEDLINDYVSDLLDDDYYDDEDYDYDDYYDDYDDYYDDDDDYDYDDDDYDYDDDDYDYDDDDYDYDDDDYDYDYDYY